jgi:hypothetical protein
VWQRCERTNELKKPARAKTASHKTASPLELPYTLVRCRSYRGTYGVSLPPSILLDAPTAHQLAACIARFVDAHHTPTTNASSHASCRSPEEDEQEELQEQETAKADDAAWHADASASAACTESTTGGRLRWLGPSQRRALLGMWTMVVAAAALSVWSMGRREGVDGQPLKWWSQHDIVFEQAKGIRPGWMGRQMDVSHWRLLEWVRILKRGQGSL